MRKLLQNLVEILSPLQGGAAIGEFQNVSRARIQASVLPLLHLAS